MATEVRVEGLRELRRELRQAGDDLSDLKDANAKVARLVADKAAALAPRRSGALAASVRGNRAAGKAQVAAGGARVPYAGPIHWGWPARGIEARPFVSDAAQQTEAQWLDIYTHDVQRVLDRVRGA